MLKQIALFIALILGFYIFYITMFPDYGRSIVGQDAPPFEATFPERESLKLKDHVGKQVILINIWATWCEPCREEIPVLNNINKTLDPQKFLIVSVMEDDAADDQMRVKALNRFKQKIPVEFPVYFDPNNKIADDYGTYRIPETYLIDLNGKVAYKHAGPITKWDEKGLIEKIKELSQ